MGWLVIKKCRATKYMSVNNLHLNNCLQNESKLLNSDWEIIIYDESDAHVIVVENKKKNLVFDLWYQQDKWNLQFFKRNSEVEESLKHLVDDSWAFNGERYEKSIDFVTQYMYFYPNVIQELVGVINKVHDE